MSQSIIMNGKYEVAHLQGFMSTPWANDATKFNHRLTLVNHREDKYGNPQTEYTNLDVNPEDVQRIQTFAAQNQGKQVFVPFIPQARKGGKDGAWLSTRLPKGAQILILEELLDSLAA